MEKLYVIKIGGNIIDDEKQLNDFISDFASVDGHKILVHGGGKLATKVAEAMNIPQQMVDGRRITDAETLKVVTMVYAGAINKNIVAKLQQQNNNAIGITGADGNIMLAHKRINAAIDYGFVGDIDAVNSGLVDVLLQQGICIVCSALTHDGKGNLLNTNADTIAQEMAKAMSGLYDVSLIYCFEKKGVLQDADIDDSVIETINQQSFEQLKEAGIVSQGMIPKLQNAFAAIEAGVTDVSIGHARHLQQLILKQSGTLIQNG